MDSQQSDELYGYRPWAGNQCDLTELVKLVWKFGQC